MRQIIFVFFLGMFCLLGNSEQIYAQVVPSFQDSVRVLLPKKANKRKETGRYDLRFFYTDSLDIIEPPVNVNKKVVLMEYGDFQGKIIRKITVQTFDPFDYSLDPDSSNAPTRLAKLENTLHIQSRERVIRNFLLFKENDAFDSLKVKETERLIRSQRYTREVILVIDPIKPRSDSIDITVYELDRWSLLGAIRGGENSTSLNATERNFLGFGHEFVNTLHLFRNPSDAAFQTNYFIPNIGRSYVQANIAIGSDERRNFNYSIDLNRPFFSPLAQWAGGVNFAHQFRTNPQFLSDTVFELSTYKLNVQDYWAGKAFNILSKNHPFAQNTRLITTFRVANLNYLQRSVERFDSLGIHTDETTVFGSICISQRRFLRDKFIFDYGIVEDVPIGFLAALTAAYQFKNQIGRPYLGAKAAYGSFNKWGYLSSETGVGSFINEGSIEQGAFFINLNYFTGLYDIKKWKFRQFAKIEALWGFQRKSYERLSLNNFYIPSAYNNFGLQGTQKFAITMQSQFYAPFVVLGFRLAPFVKYSGIVIGNRPEAVALLQNRLYSQFGLGLLINNINLAFNTFQVSIAYYPFLPNNNNHIIGINPFSSTDFGYGNFEMGRPDIVNFR